MLVLSTAHYSKFWDDLKTLVPISQTEVKRPGFHDGIRSCLQKPVVHRLFRISYLKIIITPPTKISDNNWIPFAGFRMLFSQNLE